VRHRHSAEEAIRRSSLIVETSGTRPHVVHT
jgi:hypothetical protein